LDAVDGALDGVDAPFLDLLGIAAEGRFIELDEGRPDRTRNQVSLMNVTVAYTRH